MQQATGRRARRMRPMRRAWAALVALLSSLLTVVVLAPAASAVTAFTNSSALTITSPTCCPLAPPKPASLYPSSISVSGLTGTISHLSVTLNKVSHASSDDVDVLLVGPNNKAFVLVSDAGSNQGGSGPYATTNSTITFDDGASSTITQTNSPWGPANGSATVKPVDYSSGPSDSWPSPAPDATATPRTSPGPAGTGTLDGVFGGADPNGTWSLYVVDDTDASNGSIAGGWSVNLTTASATVPTNTTVTSSTNPSRTGGSVTFTAQVTKDSGTPTGSVTFKEGATTLASTSLNGSGVASFATTSLTEGVHTITAVYGGDATSATSSGSVTQTVDNNTVVSGGSYCNPGPITLNDSGQVGVLGVASPYPSRIFPSGIGGAISNVTLTLKNLTEPNLEDLDLLLVGPGGQKFLVVSDAGGPSSAGGSVSNSTVTFDDGASFLPLKTSGGWGTSARPVDYTDTTDSFPSPAPTAWSSPQPTGAATFASVFAGANPNGTWSLYAVDDAADAGTGGSIAGGWCLNITSNSDAATTTTVQSSTNPSTTGTPVIFTAHVVKSADSSNVSSGTVTFRDGAAAVGAPVALNASGTAAVTTSSLSEGSHTITAAYNGDPGSFNLSSGTVTQQVDSPTVITGTTYCNNGGITVRDPSALGQIGTANPYPSHISVSNINGSGAKLSVALHGVTHTAVGDLDVLLVGPDGRALKLVSDAGGDSDVSNVTVNFDDSAAGTLPLNASWGTAGSSVSSKPIDYDTGTDTFPAAPAPSVTTLADLVGANLNGTWSLYVVDDTLGDPGSIGSWCLTVNVPPTAVDDAYTTQQDTAFTAPAPGVLSNDSGSSLAATPITGGATSQGGTVDLTADGAFTYHPPAGFTGDDSFTYTATNSAGTSSPATVTLHVHAAPVITGSSIDRQQGSPAASSQIATVSDAETPAGNLTVTAGSDPGISVSGITNSSGNVSANVSASCTATTGAHTVPLTVTDGDGFTGTSNLTVNVAANTPPGLNYGSVTVAQGGNTTADPTTGPSDNGSIANMNIDTVTSSFSGTVTLDGPTSATPGRVHIGSAGPAGDYTVTVSATDNCGATTNADLTIHVFGAATVNAGPDQTITLPASANLDGTVTDNGTPTSPTTTQWSQDSGPGTTTFGDASAVDTTASFDQPGTYVLRLTATSDSLSQSDTVTITVDTKPVISVPADFSVTEDPAGSGTASVPFLVTATGSPTPSIACFLGAAQVTSPVILAVGVHTIDCTATNDAGQDSGSFVVTVKAANSPPTADAGGPYTVAEGGSLSLNATGSSDLDGDSLTYSWDVNGDGTYGDATGAQPVLTWAQLSALGINDGPADFDVRVQVSDGHAAPSVSSPVTLTVTNAAPVASLDGAGGLVGSPTTLTLSATDPSTVDQAAGFDYSIDWGDGSTEGPVHGGSPLDRSHTYAHAGNYPVSVTATDKDGAVSSAATHTVTISGAETVPDPVISALPDLLVTGTPGDDTILIRPGSSLGRVTVVLNGTTLPQSSPVIRVIVNALGGNDTVTVDGRVVVPQLLYGGLGNDQLSTGFGPAVLVGGAGNDTLVGGSLRNVFIGGDGADTLTGGSAQDLLITGSTAYDAPDASSERTLVLILAEWLRPSSQSSRIGHLTGRISGGINGTHYLTTTGAGRTVLNDAFRDVAHGLAGPDWFLLNFKGGGTTDTSDRTRSETRTDL